eukprot:COSAG04_NODE_3481_length_2781_cov_14.733135_1_plen_99_part_00
MGALLLMMVMGALPRAGRAVWQLTLLLMAAATLMQSVPGGMALANPPANGGAQVGALHAPRSRVYGQKIQTAPTWRARPDGGKLKCWEVVFGSYDGRV